MARESTRKPPPVRCALSGPRAIRRTYPTPRICMEGGVRWVKEPTSAHRKGLKNGYATERILNTVRVPTLSYNYTIIME